MTRTTLTMKLAMLIAVATVCSCSAPAEEHPTKISAIAPGDSEASPRPHSRPESMLSLVLRLEESGLVVVSKRVVPNTTGRRYPHRRSGAFFRVVDAEGTVVEERGFRLETAKRSETAGPEGEMISETVEVDAPVFGVSVPLHHQAKHVRFFTYDRGEDRETAKMIGEVIL